MAINNDGGSLLARITHNPLLMQQGCEELFSRSITEMQAHPRYEDAHRVSMAGMNSDDFWADDDEWISWLRPYNVEDGILTIPVHGMLLNKVSIKFGSFVTGYTYIQRAFERGMDDPEVHTIAFDIDSYGGEVAGNFELAEMISEARGEKGLIAFANDHAYSAAYSIATASDEIVMSRSGGVGSVGVLTAHIDVSEAMKSQGVRVTFIYAGAHKVDGNPYEKLPDSVKARIQERIDRIYGEFVALVAANRGMDEQAVRDTEALTYDVSNAVDIGFADRVGSMKEELAAISQKADLEGYTMATTTQKTPASQNESASITQEQMDAAVATAKTEGVKEGEAQERARITGILNSDEAKTRPAAARMAVNAGMTVEAALASLKDMPEENAAAPAPAPAPKQENASAPAPTPFASHMSGTDVGADIEDPKASGQTTSDDLLGSFAALTGRDMRKKA